jgi:hypothetical protein
MKSPKLLWQAALRVIASLCIGVLCYIIWLGVFLLVSPVEGIISVMLWLAAPLITGVGFATGTLIFNRLAKVDGGSFIQSLVWPSVGCILGAAIVYPFGPMLIVFAMLALGTLSVATREIVRIVRGRKVGEQDSLT